MSRLFLLTLYCAHVLLSFNLRVLLYNKFFYWIDLRIPLDNHGLFFSFVSFLLCFRNGTCMFNVL